MSSFLDYLKQDDSTSSNSARNIPANDQQKATALHYARNIRYQRSMREKVLDLIVNIVDLPSNSNADPARPPASDATLFKRALTFFQPNDFDDAILERNIYEKCGYSLCPRPNLKQSRELRDRVFQSMKERRNFKLNTIEELEKWCSMECAERALFVRLQLGTEPAWLRSNPVEDIILLEEGRGKTAAEDLTRTMHGLALEDSPRIDLASSLQDLALNQSKRDAIQDRLQTLSLERGKNESRDTNARIVTGIEEKEASSTPSIPQHPRHGNDTMEGYKPSYFPSARRFGGESERKNIEMNT